MREWLHWQLHRLGLMVGIAVEWKDRDGRDRYAQMCEVCFRITCEQVKMPADHPEAPPGDDGDDEAWA